MTRIIRKLNLVIVDDDPSIVRLVETFLKDPFKSKVVIKTFTNSIDAKEWIDNHCCDVLISDIEMPEVDGLEMLKFAKHRNAWTQVVFMTAHSTWDRITEAIENGATDYLLKPLEKESVLAIVEQECIRFSRWQEAVIGTLKPSAS
ncbi:MAG: response regulator [Pirellulaceae bacterium]|nr:response regulator [Pirellulaceae bacterium]